MFGKLPTLVTLAVDECMHDTHNCDSKVNYDYECNNKLGSYTCDMKLFDILPTMAPPTDHSILPPIPTVIKQPDGS